MHITVKMMGTLKSRQPANPVELPDGITIKEAIEKLGVDASAVQVCTVNGKLQPHRDSVLTDGAELVLLPPVGGG